MNYEMMQVFLAIQKTGSITRAAETLYISQSSVSQRLQQLENELGTKLVSRSKGLKKVEFTPQGESLLAIAEQWVQLYDAAQLIKSNTNRIHIRMGGVDSVNCYIFSEFFAEYLLENQLVDLTIRTQNTKETYELLDLREISIGIVNNTVAQTHSDYQTELLFNEEYVVLCYKQSEKDLSGGFIHPDKLNPLDEIVLHCVDLNFLRWHSMWWPNGQAHVQVNVAYMLAPFLYNSKNWAIVPLSIAKSMESKHPFVWYYLHESPPKRSCYYVIRKQLSINIAKQIEHLIEELKKYLHTIDLEPT